MKKIVIITCILLGFSTAHSQQTNTNDLEKIVYELDSLLFQVGFNTCDIQQFESLISNDLVFIHDKDGVSNSEKFLTDFKNGLCKEPSNRQVKRWLIPNSSSIYPLYKNEILYGIIHNGEHSFSESPVTIDGVAKFSNVWIKEKEKWKLFTSLSFDHQPYTNN